jgi:hypothetical protein
MHLQSAAVLATVLLAFSVVNLACSKQPVAPVSAAAPAEHVAPSPVATTQNVLEKTFTLKAPVTFPFEIPAHAIRPHLHGIFESFVGQVHGTSDDTANIDFLILNEEQNAAFAGNRPSEALFSVDASHNQAVNFDLPASLNHPVKYYLVFRNPEGSRGSKVVEANFRVDF